MQCVGELIEFLEFVDMDMLAIGGEEFFFLKYSESLARVEHNFHQLLFRLFSATANLKTESKITRLRDYCGLL